MNKFITGKELVDTVDSIIWEAEKTLLIVSPFIKLDDHFKKLFSRHENKHELHLIIVFGKNENEVNRSFNKADFDYFKNFPKVSVIYVPNLHAKYYGNERKGIVTSINLYDASFKNNIEFGIYSEQGLLNNITDHFAYNTDKEAWDECFRIASDNDVVFIKRPVYEDKKFIVSYGKSYMRSEILEDFTEHFYGRISKGYEPKRLDDFPLILDIESIKPVREEIKEEKPIIRYKEPSKDYNQEFGFCIRTGEKIKFNPSQPLSYNAWKIWNEFGNPDFPEKYCHKTGKPSYGKTSVRNPILN